MGKMKGQQEVISVVLISGILIGVVGSVYFWGIPLIQKNKDISTLESTSSFIGNLNNKIKFVANNGGRDQLKITGPITVKFDKDFKIVEAVALTEGTIYSTGGEIPLGRNGECARAEGILGVHDPETICVKSDKLGENNYRTTYSLKYIKLQNPAIIRDFLLDLRGDTASGGEGNTIVFENIGVEQTVNDRRTLISAVVKIRII